ncbi:MAG: leucine-rich repeat domain-containing protein, partial [Clostridia bacterium]|nr:leucine-rich repeat domain-containing protein [Clostridia bacterium]
MKKFAFLFALIALVLLTVVSVHAEGEFVTDGDTLTGYTGTEAELVIPDGVKAIGDEAFHNSKYIEKITIPDSVETIGYNSFCDCTNLKELHLGTGVRKFGDNAIWKDYALTTITVDENNPYITVIDNVVFSKDKKTLLLFPDGYSGEYAIPDGVTKIG